MITRYLTLVLLFFCSACENSVKQKPAEFEPASPSGKKKDGLVQTKFANGKIRTSVMYKNGKKHGHAVEYYESGGKNIEVDYVDNRQHGWGRRYWENGKLYQETPYDSGKIHGVQKRYREDGKIAAEVPFFYDNPCVGLKEYLLDGTLKTDYPTIVVKTVDNLWRDGEYLIKLTMSDKSRKVEYYTGELTDGKYIGDKAILVWDTDSQGVGTITYRLLPGQFKMETINIIAKVKTVQGNYYITRRKFNVVAENKY